VANNVQGNRVTIDDVSYDVKVQPDGSYKVFDEYSSHIGNFTVRGRAVDAEDYGVELAHPVAKIGKLWVEAGVAMREAKPQVAVALCRIVQHEPPDEAALAKARAYVTWLKKQPGVLSAVLAHDPGKKKTTSITVWTNQESLAALKAPPEGAAPLKASSVELLPVVA
jgi:hypothetical protein